MKKEEQKFESILEELETIVRDLDSSLGLEESLQKFERGMALAKQAEERLQHIENHFHKIQHQFSAPASTLEGLVSAEEVAEETVS